ncbi:MAG: AlwI family type II restriction endonuclease [Planctomycetes bacterium]|nr:AlwI family type II restriction endonuclease [Planctomycetota bacterium]
MKSLPKKFPFREIFDEFLKRYSSSATYWYIPKVRTLNEENIQVIIKIVKLIFDEFLGKLWNQETQDEILNRLVEIGALNPTTQGSRVDRTALIRIWKKLLEALGLFWIQDNTAIIITDAGLEMIPSEGENSRIAIEQQIAKYQYPNPSISSEYGECFRGILPHVFLLQVLQRCGRKINSIEYELFVNLAQSQEDIDTIVTYINSWRDLKEKEQKLILEIAQKVAMPDISDDPELFEDLPVAERFTRFNRIHLDSSYQKSFFTFPSYLSLEDSNIICDASAKVDELLGQILPSLKVTKFRTLEDWFAYFGDPTQKPSWLTYLISAIEDAKTKEEVQAVVDENMEYIGEDEKQAIERAQVEKGIETFYCENIGMLESGLTVVEDGRQFSTPIGRIDLLCRSEDGGYVVVEIKAQEARDSVFGQILRYIGWVHRNIGDAENNVRGIILASQFPESARYSRIGLLKTDYQSFIKFKEHGLNVQDS